MSFNNNLVHGRWLTLLSQPKILPARIEEIKQAISSWNFSAHDFSDEELVYSALLMFEHALQMPEVHEFRLPTGRLFLLGGLSIHPLNNDISRANHGFLNRMPSFVQSKNSLP